MLEKEFIPYEQALALKELGFDEPCFAYFYHHQDYKILFDNPNQARDYNSIQVEVNDIFDYDEERVRKGLEKFGDSVSRMTSIPTFSQAFRWFREKYNLHQHVEQYCGEKFYFYIEDMANPRRFDEYPVDALREFNESTSQEESELECLKKLIEIIKNK